MDRPVPPNLPDGAFHRFLSSAFATILTLIFSWRFLLEADERNRRGLAVEAAKLSDKPREYIEDDVDDEDKPYAARAADNSGQDNEDRYSAASATAVRELRGDQTRGGRMTAVTTSGSRAGDDGEKLRAARAADSPPSHTFTQSAGNHITAAAAAASSAAAELPHHHNKKHSSPGGGHRDTAPYHRSRSPPDEVTLSGRQGVGGGGGGEGLQQSQSSNMWWSEEGGSTNGVAARGSRSSARVDGDVDTSVPLVLSRPRGAPGAELLTGNSNPREEEAALSGSLSPSAAAAATTLGADTGDPVKPGYFRPKLPLKWLDDEFDDDDVFLAEDLPPDCSKKPRSLAGDIAADASSVSHHRAKLKEFEKFLASEDLRENQLGAKLLEQYLLHEAHLGDDSSESDYCDFNRTLDTITEEDTSDLDSSDAEDNEPASKPLVTIKSQPSLPGTRKPAPLPLLKGSSVEMTSLSRGSSTDDGDAHTTYSDPPDASSEPGQAAADLADIEDDAADAQHRYANIKPQRALIIGPYQDRDSAFSKGHFIDTSPPVSPDDKDKSISSTTGEEDGHDDKTGGGWYSGDSSTPVPRTTCTSSGVRQSRAEHTGEQLSSVIPVSGSWRETEDKTAKHAGSVDHSALDNDQSYFNKHRADNNDDDAVYKECGNGLEADGEQTINTHRADDDDDLRSSQRPTDDVSLNRAQGVTGKSIIHENMEPCERELSPASGEPSDSGVALTILPDAITPARSVFSREHGEIESNASRTVSSAASATAAAVSPQQHNEVNTRRCQPPALQVMMETHGDSSTQVKGERMSDSAALGGSRTRETAAGGGDLNEGGTELTTYSANRDKLTGDQQFEPQPPSAVDPAFSSSGTFDVTPYRLDSHTRGGGISDNRNHRIGDIDNKRPSSLPPASSSIVRRQLAAASPDYQPPAAPSAGSVASASTGVVGRAADTSNSTVNKASPAAAYQHHHGTFHNDGVNTRDYTRDNTGENSTTTTQVVSDRKSDSGRQSANDDDFQRRGIESVRPQVIDTVSTSRGHSPNNRFTSSSDLNSKVTTTIVDGTATGGGGEASPKKWIFTSVKNKYTFELPPAGGDPNSGGGEKLGSVHSSRDTFDTQRAPPHSKGFKDIQKAIESPYHPASSLSAVTAENFNTSPQSIFDRSKSNGGKPQRPTVEKYRFYHNKIEVPFHDYSSPNSPNSLPVLKQEGDSFTQQQAACGEEEDDTPTPTVNQPEFTFDTANSGYLRNLDKSKLGQADNHHTAAADATQVNVTAAAGTPSLNNKPSVLPGTYSAPPHKSSSSSSDQTVAAAGETGSDSDLVAAADDQKLSRYSPDDRLCTAVATSTALARREPTPGDDPRQISSSQQDGEEAAVSAVASAEASGLNPYIAIGRASARAATVATASAAHSVINRTSGDSRHRAGGIAVVISTSCKIKGEDEDIAQDAEDVIQSMNQGANNSLDTKTTATKGAIMDAATQSSPDLQEKRRKFRVTIEQPDSPSSTRETRTIEFELPPGTDASTFSSLITNAVKKIMDESESEGGTLAENDKFDEAVQNVAKEVMQAYTSQMGLPQNIQVKRRKKNKNCFFVRGVAKQQDGGEGKKKVLGVISDGGRAPQQQQQQQEPNNNSENIYQPEPTVKRKKSKRPKPRSIDETIAEEPSPAPAPAPAPVPVRRENVPISLPLPVDTNNENETPVKSPTTGEAKQLKSILKKPMSPPPEPEEEYDRENKFRFEPMPASHNGKTEVVDDEFINNLFAKYNIPPRNAVPPRSNPDVQVGKHAWPPSRYAASSSSNYGWPPTKGGEAKSNEPREKQEYKSILQEPVPEDRRTPLTELKKYIPPEKHTSETKSRIRESRRGYFDQGKLMMSKSTPDLDAEFEARKPVQEQPRSNLVLVDIDLNTSPPKTSPKRTTVKDLKKRLAAARPKAPGGSYVDKVWNARELISKSQERGLNKLREYKLDEEAPLSPSQATSLENLRRSKSLGLLPSTFFSSNQSYPYLTETDLDLGVSKETPLVHETNLDEALAKSKSMGNLQEDEVFHSDGLAAVEKEDYDANKSESELRMSKSLGKLNVPSWYTNSRRPDQEIVIMSNAKHRDLPFSGQQPWRTQSTDTEDGYRRELARPVVIQHRVRSPVRSPANSLPSTPASNVSFDNFELPSSRFKRNSPQYKTLPIRPFAEMKSDDPHEELKPKHPAKDAYLELKEELQRPPPERTMKSHKSLPRNMRLDTDNQPPQLQTYQTQEVTVNEGALRVTRPDNHASPTVQQFSQQTQFTVESNPPVAVEQPAVTKKKRKHKSKKSKSTTSLAKSSTSLADSGSSSMEFDKVMATQGEPEEYGEYAQEPRRRTARPVEPTPQQLQAQQLQAQQLQAQQLQAQQLQAQQLQAQQMQAQQQQDQQQQAQQIQAQQQQQQAQKQKRQSQPPRPKLNQPKQARPDPFQADTYKENNPYNRHVHKDSTNDSGIVDIHSFEDSQPKPQYRLTQEELDERNRIIGGQEKVYEYVRQGQPGNVAQPKPDPQQPVQYKPYNDWEDLPPLVQDDSPKHKPHPQPPARAPYQQPPQPHAAPPSHRAQRHAYENTVILSDQTPPRGHSTPRTYTNLPPEQDMYANTPQAAYSTYTNMPSPPSPHTASNNASPRGSSIQYANVPHVSPGSSVSSKGPHPAPRPHLRSSTSSSYTHSLEEGDPQSRAFYLLQRAAEESTRSLNVSMVSNMSFDVEMLGGAAGADDPHFPPMSDNKTTVTLAESGEEIVWVKCRNQKCGKTQHLEEARKSFKTCHNCYTYYCSRECRKSHWEKHKKRCLFSKVNSICKYILKHVHDDDALSADFSAMARAGVMRQGPGCVMLVFSSHVKAEEFLSRGMLCSEALPVYCSIDDLHENAHTFGEHQYELLDMCRSYNPDIKYVLEVVVIASFQNASGEAQSRAPRKDGLSVKKCQKLRLSTAQPGGQSAAAHEEPETLILTAMPNARSADPKKSKKAREVLFSNIQKQLRHRGVSVKHHYPDIYAKLSAYVEDNDPFAPITIFPFNEDTGKRFTCVIMPEPDNPQTARRSSDKPDILQGLALTTEL